MICAKSPVTWCITFFFRQGPRMRVSFCQAQKQKYSSGTNKLYDQAEATPEQAGYSAILPSAGQKLLQTDIAYCKCTDPSQCAAQLHALHWTAGCESRPENFC